MARLTRPIDVFAATLTINNDVDDDTKKDFYAFFHLLRSQLAAVAHKIADERQDRYLQARALQTTSRKKREPMLSTEQIVDRIKETELAKKITNPKPERGASNSRGGGERGGRCGV
ncbi:hypothetical protein BGZ54_005448, partial [Gamsiella multidivaricata]